MTLLLHNLDLVTQGKSEAWCIELWVCLLWLNILFLWRITDNILAMSRPNTEMIKEKNIIEQFKK